MREADRPIEERLSVLDRPWSERDSLPEDMVTGVRDPATVRLALEDGRRRIYIGPDALGPVDIVYVMLEETPIGGSASGHPRSVLSSKGATIAMSDRNRAPGSVVFGAVPDHVEKVHVNGVEAKLRNNVYLADISAPVESILVTTANGTRRINTPFSHRPPE